MIDGRMTFISLVRDHPPAPLEAAARRSVSASQSAPGNQRGRNPQLANRGSAIQETAPPAYAREDLLASRFRVARVLPYQQSHAPFVSNLLLAFFSGVLMICAFPEWNWWSLGWVGTAPLLMAIIRERRFRGGVALGWTTGTVFYLGSSYWVTYSIHHYGEISLWASYLIALVFAVLLGSFTALFAG